jgi:hypothetical protein
LESPGEKPPAPGVDQAAKTETPRPPLGGPAAGRSTANERENVMSISFCSEKSTRQSASVTGRDGYLVLQALAYTILTIEALPEPQQEWSNKEQMKTLLEVWSRGHSEDFLDNAQYHIDGDNSSAFPVHIAHDAAESIQSD